MKKLLFLIAVLFVGSFLQSQDLHVFYDAQTDLLTYEMDGKTVQQPRAKSGSNIFLHITNYNNYLYDVEVEANQVTLQFPANAGEGDPLQGLIPGKGGVGGLNILSVFGNSGQQNFGFAGWSEEEIFEEDEDDDKMGFGKEKVTRQEKFMAIVQDYNVALKAIQVAEKELIQAGAKINQELEAQQVYGIVSREIKKLKNHPGLPPTKIKEMAGEYLQTVFNVDNIEEIDLSYVLERLNPQKVMQKHVQTLNKKRLVYQSSVGRLTPLNTRLNLLNFTGSEAQDLVNAINTTQANSQEVLSATEADMELVNQLSEQDSGKDVEYLADLRYEYEALMANDFSFTYRTAAKGDQVTFKLKLKKREGLDKPAVFDKSISDIEVPVSGGFKVNASLGLSFGIFAKSPKDYYVRDDQIFADDKEEIQPMLTSFVHFYGQRNNNASYGGSIGVGFPISGANKVSSLSFLAGPSVIIGKSSRIVISAGLMTGQVERLAQGYQVGDSFISEADNVPTKQKYELGYFLGMSYNFGG